MPIPSDEEIDLNEIKFYIYPSIDAKRYSVRNVENASIENRKRFRANVYIGDEGEKSNIIGFIQEAVDWVKELRNMPIPSIRTKNGKMEADSVYLNVYRKDNRNDRFYLLIITILYVPWIIT
ncbi:hypothetical protein [Geomicrobium sp. JCM 19055]|uniref:hypothetical protein n=1 Tax=Geomicrobium sp. JCM 19055 TaxID=1460649 RepID=UPI0005A77A79|nr:hypothetical protein [Geomicrobium sp. JCM 19055]